MPPQEMTQRTTKSSKGFYPASYLIMTVTSLGVLGAISGLAAITISYWLNGVSGTATGLILMYLIASLVVALPLHLLGYWQVRRTDLSRVTAFSVHVANALLGLYLFTVVATAILLGTWLVASWLNVWLGAGAVTNHLIATSLGLALAIALAVYAVVHFTRVRNGQARTRYYMIAISVLSVAALVLSTLFPAMAYQGVLRDAQKESDLNSLQWAISGYVDAEQKLPASLTDLKNLDKDLYGRLSGYHYTSHGETHFGIFGYGLCADFSRSKGQGRDTGLGFDSHGAGNQCFTRIAISGKKMQQDFDNYVKNVEDRAAKLQAGISEFLKSTLTSVRQQLTGIEQYATGQVSQLEAHLEGVEGGMTQLQQEMERLQGNLAGLDGNTGELAQDFAEVEQFLHDLSCLFGCKSAD